jgi:hypothetical protein
MVFESVQLILLLMALFVVCGFCITISKCACFFSIYEYYFVVYAYV